MREKPTLCLCMIAKDEEKNIERCIRSAKALVDEIIVVDTGSTDGTAALAKELGAKVYDYEWDESFANARNFAMSKATGDWLLLLDADEALDEGAAPVIREFLDITALDGAHFRIRNYTGSYSPDNYSLHSGLRLLRNKRGYRFEGEIHEQIVGAPCARISERFTALDVIVHHYGYLDHIVQEKQKRRRNIPILKKQLENNPDEPFTLFNMGNEYLSLRDYGAALQYYERALQKNENRLIAFVPHLYFRIISCHANLGEHEKALGVAREAFGLYPRCTDYEFLRADILHRRGRYTLAIDGFERCLKMGTPPAPLEFLPGCGTYRAAYQLGDIFFELEDYARAIKYYDAALSHKPNLYMALYRMGAALARLSEDKDEVKKKLLACFANPKYAPNALVGADILATEGLYAQALEALEDLTDAQGRQSEIAYVRGRALFFRGRFGDALPLLEIACDSPEPPGHVLHGIRPLAAMTLFALSLMRADAKLIDRALGYVRECCAKSEYAAASLMRNIFLEAPQEDPCFEDEGKAELESILLVLDMLLKCRHLDLFERMLGALNYVDSKDLLVRLAALYERNDLPSLAAEHVLRSVKELDFIDSAGAALLHRAMR